MSKFAERLKELRQEKGLTQTQLAQATHMGQTTISAYEAKRNHPSDDVIIVFCKFFDVSSDYILWLKDE